MSCDYTIEKALIEDMEEILRLQYIAYQSEALLYNERSIQPLTQTLEEAIEEFAFNIVLKAVSDGGIIGSIRAFEEQNTVHIGKLMVHPSYQNRGLGKLLLQMIEGEFPGKRFELFTGMKSEKNLALYEKCGYSRFKNRETKTGLTFVYLEKYDNSECVNQ